MRGDETYIYSQGKVVKDKNQSRPSKKSIYSLGNILIVRPVTLSLKHNEQERWNELSYTVGCARFFLGLPGFAYRLLIWAAVLCSNRFPSCSFGLHTWQIHIPGGGPGKKERERKSGRDKKKEAFQGWFIMSAAVTLFRYVFVVLSRADPLCLSLHFHCL